MEEGLGAAALVFGCSYGGRLLIRPYIGSVPCLMVDFNNKWQNRTACSVACNRWDRFIDGVRTRLLPRSFPKKWNQKRLNHLHGTLRADGGHRFIHRPRCAARGLR